MGNDLIHPYTGVVGSGRTNRYYPTKRWRSVMALSFDFCSKSFLKLEKIDGNPDQQTTKGVICSAGDEDST